MSYTRDHKLFRIYIDENILLNSTIILGKKQSHYLRNVLRLKIGYNVIVFNENAGEFLAELANESKNDLALNIVEQLREPQILPNLTLCFCPVKNAKTEFIIEKATELGIAEVQPIISKHTIVRKTNLERLQLAAIEATEQSERITPPKVYDEISFDDAVKKYAKTHKIMFCDEGLAENFGKNSVAEVLKNQPKNSGENWVIFIGPEGGFSPDEREKLYKLSPEKIFAVSLGSRILRADTAAIASITLWQNYVGDF
jgi:16S rRNA (uracil1498-N3)-methyltransferase